MKHFDVLFTKLLLIVTNVNILDINFERFVLVIFPHNVYKQVNKRKNSLKLCSNFYAPHSHSFEMYEKCNSGISRNRKYK